MLFEQNVDLDASLVKPNEGRCGELGAENVRACLMAFDEWSVLTYQLLLALAKIAGGLQL